MIRFRAFGAADLRGNDGDELRAVLSRPGQLGLLAYLALARPHGFHRRDTLVGMFWAETGQDQARNALRQAVHRLRRELGSDAIVSRGVDELAVNATVVWADVVAFEDALSEGKIGEALELYRGALLPGFFLSDAPGFEEWLELERARLRDRAATAAWTLSNAEATGGQLSMASHWARWACALKPDDESDLRKLIDVLVRSGDHAGAARVYQDFSERMSREYEMTPSSATRALVEPLRRSRAPTTQRQPPVREAESDKNAPSQLVDAEANVPLQLIAVTASKPASIVSIARGRQRRRFAVPALAAAASIVALGLVGWRFTHVASDPAPEAVAVFPFSIRGSADLAYLREGMVDLLSAKLDGVVGMRSIDPHAVLSTALASDSHGTAQPKEMAGVSRRLGAGAFVIGDVVELAGRVNVTGAIYGVGNTSKPIAKISVEGDVARLPQLVDELAGQLLAARTKVRDPTLAQLAALTTSSLPALIAFLEGESSFRAGNAAAARDAFLTALRYDSTFALAYIRLATTQGWSPATRIDPVALLAAARRHSARLAPLARQLLDGYDAYYHSDGTRAARIFGELTRAYPDRVEAWFMLGETQAHLGPLTGHSPADARAAFERVLALDPDNPHALVHLARIAAEDGRSDDVSTAVGRYLTKHPGADRVMEMRALRAFSQRDSRETAAVLSDARHASDFDLYSMQLVATSYAENMEAAVELGSILGDRAPSTQRGFEAVFYLLPVPGLMQGRVVRGVPAHGMEKVDPLWAIELRAVVATTPLLDVPAQSLEALRDTIARWRPYPIRASSFFVFNSASQPQIRAYLLGLLDTKLGNRAGVDSSLATLRELARSADDSSVSDDFAHILRAERARGANHLSDALREIEQFRFDLSYAAPRRFRPSSSHARFLRGEILHALGRDEEALRWYNSLTEGHEAMYLPLRHLRLAEIAQSHGDTAEAVRHYRAFVRLWKDCDPELRPLVERATAALRRLPS